MSKILQENSSIEGGGSSNARTADLGGCTPFVTANNNMETKYNSVVVYKSWIDTIKKLPIGEIDKYEAIMAILDYGFSGCEQDHWAVDMVREQIDVNNRRRENGKLGGRPKNQTETKPKPNDNQTETKEEPNNNLIENSIIENVNSIIENDNLKEKEKKESAGKPPRPTLEEIREYVKEKNYTFDSEAFFNFYESNGWKVGKNPMKSWRAACVTWQKRQTEFNKKKSTNHGRNNNDHFSGSGYTGDTI